jgi:cell division protein FtsB
VNGRTHVAERDRAPGGSPGQRRAPAPRARPSAGTPAGARTPVGAPARTGTAAGTKAPAPARTATGAGTPVKARPKTAGRTRTPSVTVPRPAARTRAPVKVRPAQPRTVPGRGDGTSRTARPAQSGRGRIAPESRTRFVFLVVALLGGGLLCLLLINTVLATGAFKITALQQSNVALAQREQSLQAQIAAEEAPSALAQRARSLGMVAPPLIHFLDLKTGRIINEPRQIPGVPTVPGYAP